MKRYGQFAHGLAALFLVCVSSVAAQESGAHIHEGVVEDFGIDVWTNRGEAAVYYPGDRIRVYFRPTHDCYVVVYSIDTEGYVRVLYPYDYDDDPYVHGGRTRRIPDAWDHHDLVVSGPSGIEYIVATASIHPISIPRWRRYYDVRYETPPELIDHVTGDPYEGMIRLNDLIIPIESREYSSVTNSTYFYVERRVWYPRYMCYDCHWPRPDYFHPYVDVCIGFEIVIVDHDWYDDWAYWRPHHPPLRHRRGCWTVRRRERGSPSVYVGERYSRRRGFKNINFSKTDTEPVDIEKVKKEYRSDPKGERRRGTDGSALPTRPSNGLSGNTPTRVREPIPSQDGKDSKVQSLGDEPARVEGTSPKKVHSGDTTKKTDRASKGQRRLWDKITDWSKKTKKTPDLSKTKSKVPERKPPKAGTPSKDTSTSKSTTPKKSTEPKKRRKE